MRRRDVRVELHGVQYLLVVRLDEKAAEWLDDHHGDDHADDCDGGHEPCAGTYAVADAYVVVGTVVLRGEGRDGQPEGEKRHGGDAFQLRGGRHGGHVGWPEFVQDGLQDDDADGGHRELQRHGQRQPQHVLVEREVPTPVLSLKLENRELPDDVDQAEQGGDALRNDCRPRRAAAALLKAENEPVVETDVQKAGDDQEDDGGDAVAKGADNVGNQAVADQRERSREHDEHVVVGHLVDFVRRVHHAQDERRAQAADDGGHRAEDEGDDDGDGHGMAHVVIVLRAEPLRRDDGQAGCQPEEEAEHEKHDAACAADGRQGAVAKRPPDDRRVRHVVELLEDVADQQGNGKPQKQFHRIACGHVFCHILS